MPRTRHAFDYPITRLFLHVGLSLQTWVRRLPRVPTPAERPALEAEVAERLSLPEAVDRGLLTRYRFHWSAEGRIWTIDLVPVSRLRKTPGLTRLRELFF
jgi:hypothetical protein